MQIAPEIDEENMIFQCNRTLNNKTIQISNSKIWTYFLDNQLRDFVIEYNFNFADIANRFQEFIAYPYKYDFTEEEIRKHWAFMHSSRYLKKDIDDEFYDNLKKNYTESKLKDEEEDMIIAEQIDFEKECAEQERIRKEREQKYVNENNIKKEKEKKDGNWDIEEEVNTNNDTKKQEKDKKVEKEEEVDTDIKNKRAVNRIIDSINKSKPTIDKINEGIKNDAKNNMNIKSIILKEKENIGIDMELNDDEVINALFKGANEIQLNYGDLNLTIPGKDYKLPEVDPKEWAELAPEYKIMPIIELSEEEKIKKREEMLKQFNEKKEKKNLETIKNNDNKGNYLYFSCPFINFI